MHSRSSLPRRLRVMIADDDATTRRVLRLLLRDSGHDVVGEAADGEKAVELCQAHRPQLAFLDIDMPRVDGHEAARRIRSQHPAIGMIMVSAVSTAENVQAALQAGANGFVVKPFNAVKLEEAIGAWLRRGPPT